MNENEQKGISLDILKNVEDLSNQVNQMMASRTKTVWKRYPAAFGLLILFGATALHEGLKELMKIYGLMDLNPWYLFIAGLAILTVTGTLYQKLEK